MDPFTKEDLQIKLRFPHCGSNTLEESICEKCGTVSCVNEKLVVCDLCAYALSRIKLDIETINEAQIHWITIGLSKRLSGRFILKI